MELTESMSDSRPIVGSADTALPRMLDQSQRARIEGESDMNKTTFKLVKILMRRYVEEFELCLKQAHFCEHGVRNNTDYDNICGDCEMGHTMGDPFQRRTRALFEAKRRMDRATRIGILAIQLQQEMPGFNVSPIVTEIQRLQNGQ